MTSICTQTELIDLRDAARLPVLRRGGKPLNYSTLWRWATRGAMSDAGERIILRTVRRPCGRATTERDVLAFLGELTGRPAPARPSPTRAHDRRRASAMLDAAGI